MRIPLFVLALVLPFALTSCMMPSASPEKMAQANEVTLEKEGIKALKVGDKAPAFTADCVSPASTMDAATVERVTVGGPAEVGENQSPDVGQWTVLYFYPADFTPNSSKHLLDLSNRFEELKAQDINVYGVTTGTADTHKQYAAKQGISVPILVDTGSVGVSYGVLLEGGKYPQRTLVGIKPDGTIGFYTRAFSHQGLTDQVLKECGKTPAPAGTAK